MASVAAAVAGAGAVSDNDDDDFERVVSPEWASFSASAGSPVLVRQVTAAPPSHVLMAEGGDLHAAENWCRRVSDVYTSPAQSFPLDRGTLVEHVHQTLMYLRLVAGHLRRRHNAAESSAEDDRVSQRLLAESAAELKAQTQRNAVLQAELSARQSTIDRMTADLQAEQQRVVDLQVEVDRLRAQVKEAKQRPAVGLPSAPSSPARLRTASVRSQPATPPHTPLSTRSRTDSDAASLTFLSGDDPMADDEFALEETERGHLRHLLSLLKSNVDTLQRRVSQEYSVRRRLEQDLDKLCQRYSDAMAARRAPAGGEPRADAGAASSASGVLVGRVFGSSLGGSAGGADAGAGGAAPSAVGNELLEAMQLYACEVSRSVPSERPATPIGGALEDHDDVSTASGRLAEVRTALRLMLEVGADASPEALPAPLMPADRSARCLHLLALQLRLRRLLHLPSVPAVPFATMVPPAAVVLSSSIGTASAPTPTSTPASTAASVATSRSRSSWSPFRFRNRTPMSGVVAGPPVVAEDDFASPDAGLLRDFSPAARRPVKVPPRSQSTQPQRPPVSGRHARASSNASDLSERSSIVAVSPPRNMPASTLTALARAPGVNFERLARFFARVLAGMWQQWSKVVEIALVVCESSAEDGVPARPRWVPDHAAAACGRCARPFKFTRRRHHCRCCGGVFCTPCSSKQADLAVLGIPIAQPDDGHHRRDSFMPGSGGGTAASVRVCDGCHSVLSKLPPLA